MLLPRLTRVIAVALWLLANPMSAQVHEGYASVPGARLFYIDTGGSGVPVVFLHPATGSVRVWEYQIPAFTAAGYRVIAFDRRGWGRTVADPSGPQPGTGAEDLLALLDSLGIQRAHIVGSAAGGFVALDFALSFPQRLRSLIVANSVGGLQDPEFLEIGRRIRPSQFDALPPEVREVGPSYRAAHREGTQRWVDLEKISRPEGPRAPAQPMRNRITFSLLETIQLPTLLITGGADMYAPPPIQQSFAAHIKGAQTLVVPEAGHSTYWEQPEQFNRAVIDFIARH